MFSVKDCVVVVKVSRRILIASKYNRAGYGSITHLSCVQQCKRGIRAACTGFVGKNQIEAGIRITAERIAAVVSTFDRNSIIIRRFVIGDGVVACAVVDEQVSTLAASQRVLAFYASKRVIAVTTENRRSGFTARDIDRF